MEMKQISNFSLLGDLARLKSEENKILATFLRILLEVKKRDLHFKEGYSSLFEFLVGRYGYSEGSAARRVAAIKVAEIYPSVFQLIERGEVHLSALHLLVKHLKDENAAQLVGACVGKSKRQVEEFLAKQFAHAKAPSRESIRITRESPGNTWLVTNAKTEAPGNTLIDRPDEAARPSPANLKCEQEMPVLQAADSSTGQENAWKVRLGITLSEEGYRNLQRVKELSGKEQLAEVMESALEFYLKKKDPLRQACPKERKTKNKTIHKPHKWRPKIKKSVRVTVYKRDEGQCSFVSAAGKRCSEKKHLHLDHMQPYAVGGADTAENLRLMCAGHNLALARQFFGAAFMKKRALAG